MMEKLTARLAELKQQYAQLSQEIQNLEGIRQQAVLNLNQLQGAIQVLEEFSAEPDPPTSAE